MSMTCGAWIALFAYSVIAVPPPPGSRVRYGHLCSGKLGAFNGPRNSSPFDIATCLLCLLIRMTSVLRLIGQLQIIFFVH